jgi:hypothetical protein
MRCGYCGRENNSSVGSCSGCGTELQVPAVSSSTESVRSVLSSDAFLPFFDRTGDFTKVDWNSLDQFIEQEVALFDKPQAGRDAVAAWAGHLAEELGGGYAAVRSRQFVCISEMVDEEASRALRFAERAQSLIGDMLGEIAWGESPTPLLVLISETDDYDAYISQFFPDGTHTTSVGVQIRTGYPQIVVNFNSWHDGLTTLAHEMSHACVSHLPLPAWLDEGVAQTIQTKIGDVPPPDSWSQPEAIWSIQSQWTPPVLTAEMAERHHAFWDEETLQGFWAGTTFHEPGDASELSYSLALVLINLIAQDYGNWLEFLSRAQHADAGQTAALECFDTGLGEIVGAFLGEGEWRPVRKKMVEHWSAAGWNP